MLFFKEKQKIEYILLKSYEDFSPADILFLKTKYLIPLGFKQSVENFLKDKEKNILKMEIDKSMKYIDLSGGIRFNKSIRFMDVPKHKHNFIEICYVVSGEITQIIDGNVIVLPQGSFVILSSNVSHSIYRANENDIMINCIIGKQGLSTNFLNLLESSESIYKLFLSFLYNKDDLDRFFIFHTKENEDIFELTMMMFKEYFGNEHPDDLVITCYLAALLKKLLSTDRDSLKSHGQSRQFLDPLIVLNYLKDNLSHVTLKETAKEFGYNADYFSRVFKQLFGRRFIDILKELRIAKAVKLLRNTDIQVKEIGWMVGYVNTTFFYKAFNAIHNSTPSEFRRINR